MTKKIGAEVEAGLRWLVVADVLRGEGDAVRRVLQKCAKTIFRWDIAHIQTEFTWVLGAQDDLLAPIAEKSHFLAIRW